MRDHPANGITDELAPEPGVSRWVDAEGRAIAPLSLADIPGTYKLLFAFQHNCPGCHSHGFPTLARLVEAFRGSDVVGFAAVQTVFEEFEHNTFEHLLADQRRYALGIPFGHDEGEGREGAGSVMMGRYRSGGTPWFVLVGPGDVVMYNHFSVDADRLIAFLRKAEGAPRPAPGTLTWGGILRLLRDGNPPPPRRMELTDGEWRQRLPAERFRITRLKGTERAHSSSMCTLFEPGRYACACCGTALFDADTKFDSGSGWPSFTQAIAPGLVAYHGDDSMGMQRVETTCAVCDAHLGHVFPDGPPPSGLRYCINALSLEKQR